MSNAPTAQQVLTPPADNHGGRPAWLDDPELTKVDFTELAQLGTSVQDAMGQQMVNRDQNPEFALSDSTLNEGVRIHPITKEPLDPAVPPAPSQASIDADQLLAQQQAQQAAQGQTQAPVTESASVPEMVTIVTGTQPDGTPITAEITQAAALQALYTQQWFDTIPAEVKQQWAAIKDGQAQALSVADIQQFQQAQQLLAQRQQQQQYAQQQPAAPVIPQRPDLMYADPEVRAHIERLEALVQQQPRVDLAPGQQLPPQQVQQYQVPVQQQQQQQTPQFQSTIDIQAEVRKAQQMEQVTAATVARYSLSDAQVAHLQQQTAQRQILPQLINQQAIRDPFGQIIRQPEFGHVLNQAYENVMATDPILRPVYEDALVASRLAQGQQITATTQSKKALAGSLASAAPAAVPSIPANPAHMSHQQTVNGIAAMLEEMKAAGTLGN